MSDPLLRLEPERVSAEPGGQVSVSVSIRNPGTIVEGYVVDVLGDGPSSWSEVVPPEVSVYPQQDSTVTVVFSPPAGGGAPAGVCPFGIRVRSTVDADASAVVEGEVDVGRVFGLQAKIVPVTSSGRWRGRHALQLTNWGNAPARLKITAGDPDEALGFLIKPDVVDVPLGGQVVARVWVRTRHPFLRGNPLRLPFQVTCEPVDTVRRPGPAPMASDPGRPVVDAALAQKPILTRAAVTAGALILIAAVAAGVYGVTRKGPVDPGLAAAGAPVAPELRAERTGPTSVRLTWKAVPNVSGYSTREADPGPPVAAGTVVGAPGPDDVAASVATDDAFRHCYQIQALRQGSPPSPWSNVACTLDSSTSPKVDPPTSPITTPVTSPPTTPVTTPPTTPVTTPPTSPATASDAWTAGTILGVGSAGQANAEKVRAKMPADLGAMVEVVDTGDYPKLTPPIPNSAVLLAVGPYPDQAASETACDQINQAIKKSDVASGFTCMPMQLGPPS